jgi:hypothetical protein
VDHVQPFLGYEPSVVAGAKLAYVKLPTQWLAEETETDPFKVAHEMQERNPFGFV